MTPIDGIAKESTLPFGRRRPLLIILATVALAIVATIVLLSKNDAPVILYEAF